MERQFMRKLELEALEERITPDTYRWIANGTGSLSFDTLAAWWNNTTNAAATQVPGASDHIRLDSNGTRTILVDSNVTVASITTSTGCGSIYFWNGNNITIDGNATSTIDSGLFSQNISGGFVIESGTLNINAGAWTNGVSIDINNGQVNINSIGTNNMRFIVGDSTGTVESAVLKFANTENITLNKDTTIEVNSDGKLWFDNSGQIFSSTNNDFGFQITLEQDNGLIYFDSANWIYGGITVNAGTLYVQEDGSMNIGGYVTASYSIVCTGENSNIRFGNNTETSVTHGILVDDDALMELFSSTDIYIAKWATYWNDNYSLVISNGAKLDMDFAATASNYDVLTIYGSFFVDNGIVDLNYDVESVNGSDLIDVVRTTPSRFGETDPYGGDAMFWDSALFNFTEIGTTPVANQNHLVVDADRLIIGSFNIQAQQGMIVDWPGRTTVINRAYMRPINEIPAGMIEGQIWFDNDEDGEFDVNEDFIDSNVTVKLHDATDDSVIETVTATVGTYHFDNIASGSYYVTFDYSNGYQPMNFTTANATGVAEELDSEVTTDLSSGDIYRAFGKTANITVGTTDYIYGVNAGIYAVPMNSSIEGTVWHDEDEDGIQDDTGVYSGIQVELRDYLGNLIATTYTDTYGNYDFDNIAANDYYVRVNYSGLALTLANQTTDDLDSDFTDVDGTWATTGVFTLDIDETLDYDCGLFEILDEEEGPPPGP